MSEEALLNEIRELRSELYRNSQILNGKLNRLLQHHEIPEPEYEDKAEERTDQTGT